MAENKSKKTETELVTENDGFLGKTQNEIKGGIQLIADHSHGGGRG